MKNKTKLNQPTIGHTLAAVLFLFFISTLTIQAQMKEAYKMANDMVRNRLNNEDKKNITILDNLEKNDVVVISGTYDHIHMVLDNLEIPYVSIDHNQLLTATLSPHQTIFVNCSSSFPIKGAQKLASFVATGGQLITTDWALKNVLEVAFPNTVAYNNKPTGDEVVRIETIDREDEVIKGFLDEKTNPIWWLEGSSYPIKILNKEKVKVLIRSKELEELYGERAIVVRFSHGEGTVYHMISHFYLQRTETRDKKQQMNASVYAKDKGASEEEIKEMSKSEVSYGEIQSANTSADFVTRMIIKQARNKKKNK